MTLLGPGAFSNVAMKAKHTTIEPEATSLLMKAASFGPGLRGRRSQGTESERKQIKEGLKNLGLDPPVFLDHDQTWIDRRAKLFETGDYPDKGVTVTVGTLKQLEQSFQLPVPVLIEHAKSPLQLGYLTDVHVEGHELFGVLSLSKEANDLIEASSAHSLSLGLCPELKTIQEVSLVKNPRILTARLFTGTVFAQEPDWKHEFAALQARIETQKARDRIDELVQAGKVLPIQAEMATALMGQAGSVVFDGESVPVSKLVVDMLEVGRPHGLFQSHAPVVATPQSPFGPEQRAFYDRYFAGLDLQDIAKNSTQ